ncbi:hypothetical protein INQ30_23870, partial [Escherichia coli]|nr:hypothetical protein [Escherichia coli]
VPNADGKVIPITAGGMGGAQSIDNSRAYNIDARGAQQGVAEQIAATMAVYDRNLNRTLAARTATSTRRYGRG